jgi:hypothetical protein
MACTIGNQNQNILLKELNVLICFKIRKRLSHVELAYSTWKKALVTKHVSLLT